MNHSSLSYISHKMISADASMKSGDKEFKYHPEGFYMSLIQEALQELSFDTFFLENEKVYDIGDCLKFPMPEGAFNVREIYLYNGDQCNPSGKQNVYYKRNYHNRISMNNWKNDRDPFYPKSGREVPSNLYYCGIRNGVIELSPNCKSFQKLVVRFNGLLCNIGEVPTIPMFFRQAVTDFVIVEALSARIAEMSEDPKKIQAWQFILNRHERKMMEPYTGSWETAQHRAKTLDRKMREDINEYHAKLNAYQF